MFITGNAGKDTPQARYFFTRDWMRRRNVRLAQNCGLPLLMAKLTGEFAR
jgi:hypothetical protein